MRADGATDDRLRRAVLAVFGLGGVGLGAELLLLGHFEDWRQQLPLVLLGVGLALALALALTQSRPLLLLFRGVNALLLVAGVVGLYYHISANIEFEIEMYPSLAGFELLWNAIQGALPALAPGALAQLGFLGALYTYRHPGLERGATQGGNDAV